MTAWTDRLRMHTTEWVPVLQAEIAEREDFKAWEDDAMPSCCHCGHTQVWHMTADHTCTAEVHDTSLDSWMRCGCHRFEVRGG